MTTISAPDLVKLRTGQHQVTPYLSVLKPVTLLSARVNNASIARGDRLIDYDTGSGASFALITDGQTLWVGSAAGKNDKGRVRVKAVSGTAATGQILVDENGIDWADDDYLTILHNYEIWPVPPRIDGGIFYKYYNAPYINDNLLPPPVAIAGSHRAGFLSAGSLVFSLDASNSYTIAQGATITGYQWLAPGGGTVAAPTSATTTVTFTTTGAYWIGLVVTDSNSRTQTTWRCFFVESATTPYINFDISGLAGDWSSGGWQVSINATGDVTLADFPDGSLAVLWSVGKIDGVEDYVNIWDEGNNTLMVGYIQSDQDNDSLNDGTGEVTFSIFSPQSVLDSRTESGTISLNAVPAPTKWYEYASWLTVGRSIHHELKWHSTALETMDVYGLVDNTLGVKNQDFSEPTILQRCNGRAADINAKLVSDRLGRLHLVQDSQFLNAADRSSLDTIMTITTDDISGDINIPRTQEGRVAVSTLDGFSFDGNTSLAYISIIPAYRPASVTFGLPEFKGAGAAQLPSQVLGGQTDANERVGRLHAVQNNPVPEIRITTPGNYLGAFDIVPSLGFYAWGVSNALLKRELSLNGINTICRRVEISHNSQSGVLGVSVVLEAEALGPDGLVGNYPTSYPPPPDYASDPLDPGRDCEFVIQSPVTFEAGATNLPKSVVIISETQAIAVYIDQGDGSRLKAICLDWSSGAIVPGTEITLDSSSPSGTIYGCSLIPGTTSVIASYLGAASQPYMIAVERTTGTTLSGGTRVALTPATAGASFGPGPIVALSATEAVFSSHVTTAALDTLASATPVSISGTTLTQGTETISIIDVSLVTKMAKVNETTALVLFATPSPNFFASAVMIALAGGVAEFGTEISLTSTQVYNSSLTAPQIAVFTETLALVALVDNPTDTIYLFLLAIENLALSEIDSNGELSTDGGFVGIVALDFDFAQLLFRNASTNGLYQTVIILDGTTIQVNDDLTQFASAIGVYNGLDALDAVTTIGIFGTSDGQAVLTTCE